MEPRNNPAEERDRKRVGMNQINRMVLDCLMQLKNHTELSKILQQIADGEPLHLIRLVVCGGERQGNNMCRRLFNLRCEGTITETSDKRRETRLVQ